jgi:phage-related protein
LANIIDIIVNGKDNASKVLERVAQTAERAFQRAERASTQLTSRMKEIGSQGRQLGENMVDMSENMIQGLTVPLALIGGVALKSAGDIDRMFSVLQAQTGNSEAAMKRLTPIVQQVFRDGLGKDLNEVATIAGHAQKNLWMLNDVQLSGVINGVAALSTILGIDAVGAIDQVRELMMKFGISSSQAMDLVAAGVKTADLNSSNLAKTLEDVKGRAEEVSAIASGDTWVQFTSMWRQLQEALKPIGDELAKLALTYLPSVISGIERFSGWFSSLSSGAKAAAVGFAAFVAVLPVVLMSLGAIIMLGSSVIGFFGSIGGALAAVTAPTWGWIAGIAALIAIFVILWNRVSVFREGIMSAWESIKSGFQSVVSFIQPAVQAVVDFVLQQWTKIQTWWSTNGATIIQAASIVWNFLVSVITTAMQMIWSVMQFIWPVVQFLIVSTWQIIKNVISSAINVILNLIMVFANLFTANWTGLWNSVKALLSSALSLIWNLFLLFFGGRILGYLGRWGASLVQTVSAAWRSMMTVISQFLSRIGSAITSRFAAIRSVVTTAWNVIRALASTAWAAITRVISSAMSRIGSTISRGFSAARSAVANAASSIRSLLSGLASQAYSWGSNLMSMFGNGIRSKISGIVAAAKSAAAKIKSFLGFSSPTEEGPGSNAHKWAPNLMSMFADGMNAGVPKIRMAATNAADATSSIQGSTRSTTSTNTSRQQPIINIYEARRTTDKEVLNALRKAAFLYG